jgi:hypothetical protein
MKHKPLHYLAYMENKLIKEKTKAFLFPLSEDGAIRKQFSKVSSIKEEIKRHVNSLTEEQIDIYYSIKEFKKQNAQF